jgi:diaminopimelate decarboxylase
MTFAIPDAVAGTVHSLSGVELPAYIYDLANLRGHARYIRSALPRQVELYYAVKANPEPEILAALGDIIDGFEVSSGGELAHVAKAAPGRPLAFGGPGKTLEELMAALRHGVHRIHVESLAELHMLAHLTADRRPAVPIGVLLRVNLPVGSDMLNGSALAMGGRATPFGLDPIQADAAARFLVGGGCPGLRWDGIHAHLASGVDADDLLTVAESVVRWSVALGERYGVELAEVNLGGGMNVDYTAPDVRFDWSAYGMGLGRIAESHAGLRLRIEPGRALTAYCGWYVSEVLDVKPSHGAEFAVIRGGTHHLRTPAAKGHNQPCGVISIESWEHKWPRPSASSSAVTFCGQLCTPKDVLAQSVSVDRLRAGDRAVFGMTGAYAWNISHRDFLMHPPPTFHFVAGGEYAEI